MKKNPKKPLTPLQQNRLLKIIIGLIAASMLWLGFAPGTGVYHLLKTKKKAELLEQQTAELLRSNQLLREEIDRLKNDTDYLEYIAREKYGLLKKNEQVFDFSPPAHAAGSKED